MEIDQSELESVPCNICASFETDKIYTKGGLNIVICKNCGLQYVNPRLTKQALWQRYSPDYFWEEYMPAHHAGDGHYRRDIHRIRSRPILDLLQCYQKQGKLLEVGCAAGFFLKVAQEDGWEVKGIEIMRPAVAYARETLKLDVFEGTLEEARLPANTFDVVVMIETVEHLLDPFANLELAYDLVRPGGIIFITVPNQNSIMRTLLGVDWSILSPAEHLYYFTEETMTQLLNRAGFQHPKFIWRLSNQSLLAKINPYHTHRPKTARARAVKIGTRILSPLVTPFVERAKRTDRLMVMATK